MATLRKWIQKQADGESVEALVIGRRPGWDHPDSRAYPYGDLLTLDAVPEVLDCEFDEEYGRPGCHPVYAWTAHWVIAIDEYDGSTIPVRLPRHPMSGLPRYIDDR